MTAIAELWDTLRSCQQGDLAPVLISHGVTTISALRRRVEDLQAAGIPQWKLECILAAKADLPRVWQGKRASLQAALDAAQPNQRQRALQELEDDMMARSTNPAMESRLRTYRIICDAWEVEPFPLSMTNIRAFGASMKQGGYRSASVYFQTLCTFQQRNLSTEVPPLVRRCIRDCVRSIRRGLGASTLKDAFDGRVLGQLDIGDDETPFNMDNPFHARDVCVIGMWFMLREQELAGARLGHLTLSGQEVCLSIPIHKTDIYGSLCERRLKCSCLVRQHGLCVWHAAERHLIRIGQRSDLKVSVLTPLFPTSSGQTASKHQFIMMMRKVIASTGTDTMRADPHGIASHRSTIDGQLRSPSAAHSALGPLGQFGHPTLHSRCNNNMEIFWAQWQPQWSVTTRSTQSNLEQYLLNLRESESRFHRHLWWTQLFNPNSNHWRRRSWSLHKHMWPDTDPGSFIMVPSLNRTTRLTRGGLAVAGPMD